MARPRKHQRDVRTRIIPVRYTDGEVLHLKQKAAAAGVTYARFIREASLGKPPRARPRAPRMVRALVRELLAIANNFRQLEEATNDSTFGEWAVFAGKEMLEGLLDREGLGPVIEANLEAVNAAGHLINGLARRANMGKELDRAEVKEVVKAFRDTIAPIKALLTKPVSPPARRPRAPHRKR